MAATNRLLGPHQSRLSLYQLRRQSQVLNKMYCA
jgi:hypothetical protein